MKVIEIESTVDKHGKLEIPVHLMSDMGIIPGDKVRLAYISKTLGCLRNTYSEFVITPCDIAETLSKTEPYVHELGIPNKLLEAANISPNSDIEIICKEGAIVITEADLLDMIPDELCRLFAELDISPETVRSVIKNGGVSNE